MQHEPFQNYEFEVEHNDDGYQVSLPHQCSRWDVISCFVQNKEEAVRQMELFVAQAKEALEKLQSL